MQNGCWDSAKADCDRFVEVKNYSNEGKQFRDFENVTA